MLQSIDLFTQLQHWDWDFANRAAAWIFFKKCVVKQGIAGSAVRLPWLHHGVASLETKFPADGSVWCVDQRPRRHQQTKARRRETP